MIPIKEDGSLDVELLSKLPHYDRIVALEYFCELRKSTKITKNEYLQ